MTDTEPTMISSRQQNYDCMLELLENTHKSLDVFSYNLDGNLYDTSEILAALKNLSLKNKSAQTRILLRDMDYITKHGHRIIELSRRIPSFIEIRKVNPEFEHIICSYIISDNRGCIYRGDALRYEGKVSHGNPMLAQELQKQFNEIWNHSSPSPETRRLHI